MPTVFGWLRSCIPTAKASLKIISLFARSLGTVMNLLQRRGNVRRWKKRLTNMNLDVATRTSRILDGHPRPFGR